MRNRAEVVAEIRVYNVTTPMNFNNRNQNRIDTCNVHDNDFAEPAPAK